MKKKIFPLIMNKSLASLPLSLGQTEKSHGLENEAEPGAEQKLMKSIEPQKAWRESENAVLTETKVR